MESIMERYKIDGQKRMIELMDEHQFEIIVIDPKAQVQVFLKDEPWGHASKDCPFKWTGLKAIGKISLQSNIPTEIHVV